MQAAAGEVATRGCALAEHSLGLWSRSQRLVLDALPLSILMGSFLSGPHAGTTVCNTVPGHDP